MHFGHLINVYEFSIICFQLAILTNVLVIALSASFEYLCYGSTAITNIYPFSAGTVFIRQNLTSTTLAQN